MTRGTWIAAALVGCVAITSAAADAATITEWRVSFRNPGGGQIAAAGGSVYFVGATLDFPLATLCRLDPASNAMTEWPLPYQPTSPGGIAIRTSDGAVFVTSSELGEIGQLDPEGDVFRRWTIQTGAGGPRGLAIDAAGAVYFTSGSTETASYFGRLDTATNTVTTWQLPASMASAPDMDFPESVSCSADGVFANVSGFGHREIVRLDPATGGITAWPTPEQAAYASATDGAGNVFFQQIGDGPRHIARLALSTGQMTAWEFPGYFNSAMTIEAGRPFIPLFEPAALTALDPTVPGTEMVLVPLSETIVPTTDTVAPVVTPAPHPKKRRPRPVTYDVAATTSGAFAVWPIAGQVGTLAGDGAGSVYYVTANAQLQPIVGRLTP